MEFVTIDFETAAASRNSPCEVGLSFVSDKQIKKVQSWLIKPECYPYFDGFNMSIHGITPEDVKNAPTFAELWDELQPLVNGQLLIAHNASFDMSVLRKTLELYDLPFPDLQYSCSYIFSKKVWEGLPAYDLKSLCRMNRIPLNHHRAAADSEATAKLSLLAFEQTAVECLDDFPTKLQTTVGKLFAGGYNPCVTKRVSKGKPRNTIIGNPAKHNPDSIFYGRSVVFTGTLNSMARQEAQQLIADVGGINGKGVTNSTDFLVVGQQDYRVVGDDGMSSKQEKAIKLIQGGADLEILSEEEFMRSL